MQQFEYFVVVALGALMLAIEAHRQFAHPAEDFSYERYPILRGVQPAELSTPSEHRRGYVFYILCYMTIYALLLGSNSLRNLLAETASGRQVAGSGGSVFGSGDSPFSSANIGMPIYLSAGIVALLSTGIASKVELAIRGFAYRLAGIPRGVYRVITRLNQLNYSVVLGDYSSSLEEIYTDRLKTLSPTLLDKELVSETCEALRQVDLLAPSVTGGYGTRFWPRENVFKLQGLIDTQQRSMEELRLKLSGLAKEEQLQEFHLRALDTRNNLQALFAILFIRNKKVYLPSDHNPTARIVKELRLAEKAPALSHRIVGALLLGCLLYLVASCAIDLGYQHWLANQDGSETWAQTISMQGKPGLAEAVFRTLAAAVSMGVAAAVAVMVRENRLESEDWEGNWRLNQVPLMDFISATFWPSVSALIAAFAWGFLSELARSWFQSGKFPSEQLVVAVVRSMMPFVFYNLGLAFIVALFVFLAADMHSRLHAIKTIAFSVLFALLYAFVAIVAVGSTYGWPPARPDQWTYKEMAIQATPAFFFFVALAAILEWSETDG